MHFQTTLFISVITLVNLYFFSILKEKGGQLLDIYLHGKLLCIEKNECGVTSVMYCFYIWAAAQIILESFPISSSGHNALLAFWCPLPYDLLMSKPFITYIDYALHLPTAIIICLFFIKEWSVPFIYFRRCWKIILKISCLTALASVVTVLGYGISSVFQKTMFPLPISFAITGLTLLSLRWCPRGGAKWDIPKAIILGMIQAFAFVPGISRLACTYVASRWMGIPARRAFQISFLIQWPLILSASCYSCFLLHAPISELLNLPFVLVMLSACVIAYAGLYLVSQMVKKKILWWWSAYMLLPITVSLITGVLHA